MDVVNVSAGKVKRFAMELFVVHFYNREGKFARQASQPGATCIPLMPSNAMDSCLLAFFTHNQLLHVLPFSTKPCTIATTMS